MRVNNRCSIKLTNGLYRQKHHRLELKISAKSNVRNTLLNTLSNTHSFIGLNHCESTF